MKCRNCPIAYKINKNNTKLVILNTFRFHTFFFGILYVRLKDLKECRLSHGLVLFIISKRK